MVPSEYHMKNILSLSNNLFKCEAQQSEAQGEFLVNMVFAMSNSVLESPFKKNVKLKEKI